MGWRQRCFPTWLLIWPKREPWQQYQGVPMWGRDPARANSPCQTDHHLPRSYQNLSEPPRRRGLLQQLHQTNSAQQVKTITAANDKMTQEDGQGSLVGTIRYFDRLLNLPSRFKETTKNVITDNHNMIGFIDILYVIYSFKSWTDCWAYGEAL